MIYWFDEHYYGVGLGAAGYLEEQRYTNTVSIEKYNKGEYIEETESVTRQDDLLYFVMLNLRTINGINFERYHNRFQKHLSDLILSLQLSLYMASSC